jgi:hypothetical protein
MVAVDVLKCIIVKLLCKDVSEAEIVDHFDAEFQLIFMGISVRRAQSTSEQM